MVHITCFCLFIYLNLHACSSFRSSIEYEELLDRSNWYEDNASRNEVYDSEGDDSHYEENVSKLSGNNYKDTKRNFGRYYSSENYESEEYLNSDGKFKNSSNDTLN